MTRGKHGTSAEARHRIEELEAEVAKLRHALGRSETQREEATASLRRREQAHAIERRALLADVEAGASARTREMEKRQAGVRARLEEAEAALLDLDKVHTQIWQWAHGHLEEEHGMGYADGFEYMLRVIGVEVGGLSKIGVAGAKRDHEWVSLLGQNEAAVAALQRARGIRR